MSCNNNILVTLRTFNCELMDLELQQSLVVAAVCLVADGLFSYFIYSSRRKRCRLLEEQSDLEEAIIQNTREQKLKHISSRIQLLLGHGKQKPARQVVHVLLPIDKKLPSIQLARRELVFLGSSVYYLPPYRHPPYSIDVPILTQKSLTQEISLLPQSEFDNSITIKQGILRNQFNIKIGPGECHLLSDALEPIWVKSLFRDTERRRAADLLHQLYDNKPKQSYLYAAIRGKQVSSKSLTQKGASLDSPSRLSFGLQLEPQHFVCTTGNNSLIFQKMVDMIETQRIGYGLAIALNGFLLTISLALSALCFNKLVKCLKQYTLKRNNDREKGLFFVLKSLKTDPNLNLMCSKCRNNPMDCVMQCGHLDVCSTCFNSGQKKCSSCSTNSTNIVKLFAA